MGLHGPSIDQRVTLPTGVTTRDQPKRAASSVPSSTQAFDALTPNTRSSQR